ncbi:hypothetical protein Tco_0766923 [Tanacetum coccineum]
MHNGDHGSYDTLYKDQMVMHYDSAILMVLILQQWSLPSVRQQWDSPRFHLILTELEMKSTHTLIAWSDSSRNVGSHREVTHSFEEDSDPEQAQTGQRYAEEFALIASTSRKLYKPNNINSELPKYRKQDMWIPTPRYKNVNSNGDLVWVSEGNKIVVGARETLGGQ